MFSFSFAGILGLVLQILKIVIAVMIIQLIKSVIRYLDKR